MRESEVEREFKRHVERLGWWCLKLKVLRHAGFPDRMLLKKPGRVAFVELKAPGKSPRPLQAFVLKKLKQLGFDVYVIDSLEAIAWTFPE